MRNVTLAIEVSTQIVLDAIDLCVIELVAFWDALILATAVSGRCSVLLTEDLAQGREFRGVRVESPFGARGVN